MQIEIIDNFLIAEDYNSIISFLPPAVPSNKTGHFHTKYEENKNLNKII